jgi:hypothetical protein
MAPTTKTKAIDIAPGHVKAWQAQLTESGPEVTLIRVPISSTVVDRDGDEFSMAGLESMAAALRSGKVPLYLDHGQLPNGTRLYGALDMVGAWINGEIEGDKLYGTAFLEPGNWLGDTLIRKIDVGLPIGFSAGFWVNEAREKPNGGLIFDDVSLWEVSAVGIPSNPDAVNSAAVAAVVKSLRVKAGLETDEMKRKTKETEEEPKEEEQEEEKQPESCEEEEKAQEEEPTEEEEEEKSYEVLDEAQIRQIVAEEVGKALAPITEALKSLAVLNEIKALVTKAVATRSKGPRGIVVAREVKEPQKNPETPAASPYKPLY